jgi:putative endonuclease
VEKLVAMPRSTLFFTYILTNWNKTVLYTGMTNDLAGRLVEHWVGKEGSFTTRYGVYYLVWYDRTKYVLSAIDAEKTIKHYTRAQKEALIVSFNPEWKFLNEEIIGNWPPTPQQIAEIIEQRQKPLYPNSFPQH